MGKESPYECGVTLYSLYEVAKPLNGLKATELSRYTLITKHGSTKGDYGVCGR